jgi:flagellar basal-body rod protein FlgF
MGDGIYTALTGAIANEHQLDTLANNLANASTSGFRADRVLFRELIAGAQRGLPVDPRQPAPPRTEKFVQVAENRLDFTPGPLRETDNPLDAALNGPGYFLVRTGRGDMLTRAGNFMMREDGILMTAEGATVLGDNGEPIQFRRDVRDIRIMSDGVVRADDIEIAKLAIRDVRDPNVLLREGLTTYGVPPGTQLVVPLNVEVIPRHLEGSNVSVISGMNQIINVNRSFDALHKVIESFQQIDQRTARDIGSRNG